MIDRVALPQELELLVRRIVAQCLEASGPGNGRLAAPLYAPQDSKALSASAPAPAGEAEVATLSSQVVSVESLKSLSVEIRRIAVMSRTVITPAARDWLRERGITIEQRSGSLPVERALASVSQSMPWQVLGSRACLADRQREQIQRAFCSKQLMVAEGTGSDELTFQAWNQWVGQSGGDMAVQYVLLVESPYRWLWQSDVAAWRPAIWDESLSVQEAFQETYRANPMGPRLWFVRGPLATHRLLPFLRQWVKRREADGPGAGWIHGGKR